jgi:SPP1 gp7 family putative phage head morphogenesis protein
MDKSLRDVYLRHGIYLTRYANHEARKLVGILDASSVKIRDMLRAAKAVETKEKYYRIAAEIKRVTKDCHEQLAGQLELDFMKLAEEETRFAEKALRGARVKADFELPAPKKIWAAASFGNYAGYGSRETYQSYLDGLGNNLFKTWDIQTRVGYMAGLTAKQINRNVLGTVGGLDVGSMQVLRRSLEMNTRTMVAHLAETARDALYKENAGLFSGYKYLGTLDSRSCLVCGNLDGKVFKEIEDAPKLPKHPNCRCLLVPLVKGMEEDDEDDTRASEDGPVPAKMTFTDWLKTQPDEFARDILGPVRFSMYKEGTDLSGFVAGNRILTLKQLEAADGLPELSIHDPSEANDAASYPEAPNLDELVKEFENREGQEVKSIPAETEYIRDMGIAAGNKIEFGTFIQNGVIMQAIKGVSDHVPVSFELETKILKAPDNSVVMIHFHPSGSSLGKEDVGTFGSVRAFSEFHATTATEKTFSMLRKSDSIYEEAVVIENEYRKQIPKVEETLQNKDGLNFDALPKKEQDIIVSRGVCQLLAKKYHWDYREYDHD